MAVAEQPATGHVLDDPLQERVAAGHGGEQCEAEAHGSGHGDVAVLAEDHAAAEHQGQDRGEPPEQAPQGRRAGRDGVRVPDPAPAEHRRQHPAHVLAPRRERVDA